MIENIEMACTAIVALQIAYFMLKACFDTVDRIEKDRQELRQMMLEPKQTPRCTHREFMEAFPEECDE